MTCTMDAVELGRIGELPDDGLHLPYDPRSVGSARRFVRDHLLGWGLDDLVDDANLVVSELAANAVLHARSDYTVRATRRADSVRVEIEDHVRDVELRAGARSDEATSGRGLMLVTALSSSWGVVHGPSGKTVWAELAVA